ncbi:MAG: hypothetical protein ACLQVN_05475 [Bryobacteraceae bacterium]
MSRFAFQKIAFAGAVLFGSQFIAQAQITTTLQSASTSGIVGLASTETAQLNVFNLQEASVSASATATSAACQATLAFYDSSGKSLVSSVVNIAPGATASLPYAPAAAIALRTEIRAVVITQAILAASTSSTVMPVSASCNLFPSLEIVDVSARTTHIFTTDFRVMSPSGPQPASTGK